MARHEAAGAIRGMREVQDSIDPRPCCNKPDQLIADILETGTGVGDHETDEIEQSLKAEADRHSNHLAGAPVVIVMAGDSNANFPWTMTASSNRGRDP